jgi:hypothetical protein
MWYTIITSVLAVWLLLVLIIYVFQSRLIFYPEKDIMMTPADVNLPFRDVFLQTDAGTRIHGWYIPHDKPRATLLFLHGNAGNISQRLDSVEIFYGMGLSVFIIDYQGYGRSAGSPSESGTYQDARAAWSFLTGKLKLPAQQVVVFGRSLGGAVAVWLAAEYRPGALILESTFTSVADLGKHYYPYLPVQWLTRIRYPTLERISRVACPLLVIHSRDDEIIPFVNGQKLYAAARAPKEFLQISGGHNEGFLLAGSKYIDGLQNFIDTHVSSDIAQRE